MPSPSVMNAFIANSERECRFPPKRPFPFDRSSLTPTWHVPDQHRLRIGSCRRPPARTDLGTPDPVRGATGWGGWRLLQHLALVHGRHHRLSPLAEDLQDDSFARKPEALHFL